MCYIISNMNYPIKIKELRDRMLVSQVELAKELGCSFASVNRWERGHHEPTIQAKRKLRALFKKYGVSEE